MTADDRRTTDEEYAVMLLSPLAGDPATVSRVDVARAVAEGRRRRHLRWYSGGAAVAALTASAVLGGPLALSALDRPAPAPRPDGTGMPTAAPSATAAAPPVAPVPGPASCTVTRLPTGGVAMAVVSAGDPSGRWATGRTYPAPSSGAYPIIVWKDGKVFANVQMPGSDQGFRAINTAGVAVGSSYSDDGEEYPYVYAGGKVSRLAGGTGSVTGINDAGRIVGNLGPDGSGPAGYRTSRPVVWASPTAQPVDLTVPAGSAGVIVSDIDEDGTMLGRIIRSDERSAPYLWAPDGTGRELPMPTVDGKPARSFLPTSLRNGWMGGHVLGNRGEVDAITPFRYRIDADRYERLGDDGGTLPRMAANGWALVEAGFSSGSLATPAVVSDTGVLVLPDYPKLTGKAEYQMAGISDDGRVIVGHGWGTGETSDNQPLIWRCR